MINNIFVFNPIATDKLSKVRGIGRYLQILQENFEKEFKFVDSLKNISYESIFINPFFNFLKMPLIMKRVAKKQVAVIHDLIPLKYPTNFPIGLKGNLNAFLNGLSLKNYDLIITDSIASKNDVIKILGLRESVIKVIYPCLPKIFSSKMSIENNEWSMKKNNSLSPILNIPYCLYVGDVTWNKNLVNLARAIKKINVTCIFVGKVFEQLKNNAINYENLSNLWQKEFKQFIRETKDDKRFIFKGFISDNELIKLYQQARCNILPSRDEGFGFSYIESASQRCPSVLSNIPVLKEISDEKALFADPEKIDDIANNIGELFFTEFKRKEIITKAYKRSKFFSSSSFRKSFLNVLKNLYTHLS